MLVFDFHLEVGVFAGSRDNRCRFEHSSAFDKDWEFCGQIAGILELVFELARFERSMNVDNSFEAVA